LSRKIQDLGKRARSLKLKISRKRRYRISYDPEKRQSTIYSLRGLVVKRLRMRTQS
jgi:hypothetical protein